VVNPSEPRVVADIVTEISELNDKKVVIEHLRSALSDFIKSPEGMEAPLNLSDSRGKRIDPIIIKDVVGELNDWTEDIDGELTKLSGSQVATAGMKVVIAGGKGKAKKKINNKPTVVKDPEDKVPEAAQA